MGDIRSLAPHTRLTCHQRIYGGIRWDQFVHLAILATETLTDLKTELVVANNNNSYKAFKARMDLYFIDHGIIVDNKKNS